MAIKAIIFDLDGVLLSAKEWHFKAFQLALKEAGVSLTKQEHDKRFCGLPTKAKLLKLVDEGRIELSQVSSIDEKKQSFTMDFLKKTKRSSKLIKIMNYLKKESLQVAVASNGIQPTVHTALERLGIIEQLDFYLSNKDVKLTKPSPEIYQQALERLNIFPEEALVFEDSQFGIQSALAAGVNLIRVADTSDITLEFIIKSIKKVEDQDDKFYYSNGG